MCYFIKCILSLVILNSIWKDGFFVSAISDQTEKDLIISHKDKQSLEALLKNMKGSLTHDYMKSDIFLIRWLRAGDLDLKRAETKLRSHLEWRKDNRIDSILKEDFSVLEYEYPVDVEGVAYNGAPVYTTDTADWDVRRAILAGQEEKLFRYILSRIEVLALKVRVAQDQGKNVTRFYVIDNLNGFNVFQHGCLQCMPFHIRLTSTFSAQYPGMIYESIYINAPSTIEFAVRALRSVSSKELQDSTKIFGTNQREWKDYIFKLVAPDQLGRSFGGTRK